LYVAVVPFVQVPFWETLKLSVFHRVLRGDYKEVFDSLMNKARHNLLMGYIVDYFKVVFAGYINLNSLGI